MGRIAGGAGDVIVLAVLGGWLVLGLVVGLVFGGFAWAGGGRRR